VFEKPLIELEELDFSMQSTRELEHSRVISRFLSCTIGQMAASIPKMRYTKQSLSGYWWLMPVILATWEAQISGIVVQSQPWQRVCKSLSQKYPTQKRAGGVARVAEHLLSKCEALSSNPSANKKKKFWEEQLCSCWQLI
jgi:hypothetical protein